MEDGRIGEDDAAHALEAEARRNRETRARNRAAEEARARTGQKPLVRWAKWAAEPRGAAVHAVRLARQRRRRAGAIAAYLDGPGFKGVHVGCGPFLLPGWQNTEFFHPRPFFRGLTAQERAVDFHLDITEPLPYPDASLDAIFAEEVIEHVPVPGAETFLHEARRVLRPGGTLRLTTPDARGIARVFAGAAPDVRVEDFEPFWLNPYWSEDHWLNGNFRYYGHQHLYSFEGLSEALRAAGFADIVRLSVGETASGRAELAGLERHSVRPPEVVRIMRETRMIVEAR